ncbi:MAG: hypothetical protein IKJ43_01060 [Bacilli bacterium]|nr:hypothetical protein [Bacilli bacterium]
MKIINRLIYILLLSGFNTLYKYVLVNESLSLYNNSNFMGSYISNSSYQISYFKVFALSFFALFLIEFWKILFIYLLNKRKYSFEYILNRIYNDYIFIIGILISGAFLFVNYYVSFTILFISFFAYLFKLKKDDNMIIFVVSLVFLIITVISLWFISC